MRRFLPTGLIALAVLVPGSSAGAAGNGPQVTDMAGDANGLPVGVDTRPLSLDPADLLAVQLSTAYRVESVGADGKHYRATGLTITFRTLGVPSTPGPTIDYQLEALVGGCLAVFTAHVGGSASLPSDGRDRTADWTVFDLCEPINQPFIPTTAHTHSFPVQIDAAAHTLSFTIPYAEVPFPDVTRLAVGTPVSLPQASDYFSAAIHPLGDAVFSAPVTGAIDGTGRGERYVIGSDLPPDVPCTQSCP